MAGRAYWSGKRRRGRRQRTESRAAFARRAILLWAAVAIATWHGIPRAQSIWADLQRTAEQRRAHEASAWYPNCDAARAAGVAPIHRGEPGYREGMDGDSDGIACEPYP
jgi:hypothetical protein